MRAIAIILGMATAGSASTGWAQDVHAPPPIVPPAPNTPVLVDFIPGMVRCGGEDVTPLSIEPVISLSSLTPMKVTSGAIASRFADSPVPWPFPSMS